MNTKNDSGKLTLEEQIEQEATRIERLQREAIKSVYYAEEDEKEVIEQYKDTPAIKGG